MPAGKNTSAWVWHVAILALAFACVTYVAILVFAQGDPAPPGNGGENTITLGAVVSSTGRYQTNGNNTFNGYKFAIERINKTGGVKVQGKLYRFKIKTYDDQSDPGTASRLAERLIREDGIIYMLGPYSSELTKAVSRVTEKYQVPLVEAEGAARNLFKPENKYIFGLLSTCEHYLARLVDLAVDKAAQAGMDPGDLEIATIVENDEFSLCVRSAVLEQAVKSKINITIDEKLPKEIKDMRGPLSKVQDKSPDILVISGHSRGAEVAVSDMQSMQITVPITAITHCEAAELIQKFGAAAEGIYCPAQWAPSLPYEDDIFGTAKEFSEAVKSAYPDRYQKGVPYQVASAVAAVLVWKDAFERANSFDQKTLRDVIAETDLMTFYGRIEFAPTGQIISKPMVLRQIRDGKYEVVDIPAAASGP